MRCLGLLSWRTLHTALCFKRIKQSKYAGYIINISKHKPLIQLIHVSLIFKGIIHKARYCLGEWRGKIKLKREQLSIGFMEWIKKCSPCSNIITEFLSDLKKHRDLPEETGCTDGWNLVSIHENCLLKSFNSPRP